MPGPLTLLLPKRAIVPDACTAGREKVGIRIPAHPVALALIEAAGVPIAAPSANRFGGTSPTTAAHVERDLDGRIDAILDSGPAEVGVESTVIDITAAPPIIYRPGGISREQIESVIGPVRIAPEIRGDRAAREPGIARPRHPPLRPARYARYWSRTSARMATAIERLVARGEHVGLMLPTGWLSAEQLRGCVVFSWGDFDQLPMLAARLYAGLRWLDEHQATVIVCPTPPATGIGLAILDRLRKAATPHASGSPE